MTDVNFKIEDRTIEGDVSQGYLSTVEQFGTDAFLQAVDAVLDIDGVEALRWMQYTPYFNDGEPCEFGFHWGEVKLDERFGEVEGEYGEDWLSEYDLYSGYKPQVFKVNGQDTEEIYNALQSFEAKAGHFENVLKLNFGDHAQVTATREGFSVEYYDHD